MSIRNSHLTLLYSTFFFLTACQDYRSEIYFPLANGKTMHYQTSFKAGGEFSKHRLIVTNEKAETLADQTVFPQKFHNGMINYYSEDQDGIFQVARYTETSDLIENQEKFYLIKKPISEGSQWQQTNRAYFLEKTVREINAGQASLSGDLVINPLIMQYVIDRINETVTVPAGTIEHCIRIKGKGETKGLGSEIGAVQIHVEQTEWYGPGIGLIKLIRTEKTNLEWAKISVYTQELDRVYH